METKREDADATYQRMDAQIKGLQKDKQDVAAAITDIRGQRDAFEIQTIKDKTTIAELEYVVVLLKARLYDLMENEDLVEALKNRDNEKVIELLDSEF